MMNIVTITMVIIIIGNDYGYHNYFSNYYVIMMTSLDLIRTKSTL